MCKICKFCKTAKFVKFILFSKEFVFILRRYKNYNDKLSYVRTKHKKFYQLVLAKKKKKKKLAQKKIKNISC